MYWFLLIQFPTTVLLLFVSDSSYFHYCSLPTLNDMLYKIKDRVRDLFSLQSIVLEAFVTPQCLESTDIQIFILPHLSDNAGYVQQTPNCSLDSLSKFNVPDKAVQSFRKPAEMVETVWNYQYYNLKMVSKNTVVSLIMIACHSLLRLNVKKIHIAIKDFNNFILTILLIYMY